MMSKKLINEMIDNYNEKNLKTLDEHIKKSVNNTNIVQRMVVDHKGPTKVTVTEKSMSKLAKVVLDL